MFRIRTVHDDIAVQNKRSIQQVKIILKEQFPGLQKEDIHNISQKLLNPLKYQFKTTLFIADDNNDHVQGFALLLYAPNLNFCYLDYVATTSDSTGRGIGSALYERIRQDAKKLKAKGLFFECLPDEPPLCTDKKLLEQNKARLRFYERYGARPIANNMYASPLSKDDDNPPYLCFDRLGKKLSLTKEYTQKVVKAILTRKYSKTCPAEYIDRVVSSFQDTPLQLRPPRYIRKSILHNKSISDEQKIALFVNDKHLIHHVKDKGYVESPVRITSILRELEKTPYFARTQSKKFGEEYVLSVHDSQYIDYFKKVCAALPEGKSVYPYVFPIRNETRPPKELDVRAGYYCIDTFTPLNSHAYTAARGAVDCALSGATQLLAGKSLSYALVRPPGHHAEKKSFGGFCYFNSNAIATQFLSKNGRVALLDIDYHHGNGQQQIFYERNDIMTISIHGHPKFAYPYFSGFMEEKGTGDGEGYNINYPLPEHLSGEEYALVLQKALRRIQKFSPQYLVVALGLDTAQNDPTGTWSLKKEHFYANGLVIGRLGIPTLVVQEGGYRTRVLGIHARHFFEGLWYGMYRKENTNKK